MKEVKKILDSISEHCKEEFDLKCRNTSIGRGEIIISGLQPQLLWIVNKEYKGTSLHSVDITGAVNGVVNTGIVDSLDKNIPGEATISKNKEYARRLIASYEGPQKCIIQGMNINFIIKNSAHYTTSGRTISNLKLGIAGMPTWQRFSTFSEAYRALVDNEQELIQKRAEEAKAKELAEKLRIEKQEAEAKKVEEESKRIATEIGELERKKQAIVDDFRNVREFLQNQIQLRRNPILDPHQDKAKFSNLYNNVVEVINGGPGTGKSTTIIQRLKLLIDKSDLIDFMQNHPGELTLSDSDLEVIGADNDWIFFSPNEKLKNYLRDNMDYEGLSDTASKTAVWTNFLKDIAINHYHIVGVDAPFEGILRKKENLQLYRKTDLSIVDSFIRFYITKQKEKFMKMSKIDYKNFDWKIIGKIIIDECKKIEAVQTLDDFIDFLYNLERSYQDITIKGQKIDSPSEISEKYSKALQELASKYIVLLKRDEEKYEEARKYVTELSKPIKDEEIAEEDNNDDLDDLDTEEDYGDIDIKLDRKIKKLLKKMILKLNDSSVKLTSNDKKLYDMLAEYINDEELKCLASGCFFTHRIYTFLKSVTTTLLSPIPQIYKAYRKNIPEEEKKYWNEELLEYIVKEKKNKVLHPEERPVLIGFINNLIKSLYARNTQLFDELKHKYITAYKNICRPVIGIDEATDYTLIDYYGIASISHYKVSTITLCGDTMQLMIENGIRDWNTLNDKKIFPNMQILNLNMSYRQSLSLMELAGKIYKAETGLDAPYECYLQSRDTPKPLWFESENLEEKAQWISERVIEIIRSYNNSIPSIAIFTKDDESGEELKEALEDCENLSSAGLEIEFCKHNTLDGEKSLRIFSIDQVKGLEFEAVFFHDIDKIESTSLINRYLYVGVSRASMYLGVTSNGESEKISELLQGYFTTNEHWS